MNVRMLYGCGFESSNKLVAFCTTQSIYHFETQLQCASLDRGGKLKAVMIPHIVLHFSSGYFLSAVSIGCRLARTLKSS